jgi:nicotinate-nucleotide adenylyltransferase
MKIGLYFGSFNPVHNGHLIISNYIAENTDLDQVWLVVSPQNPLKSANGLLNEYDRLHLVRISIEGEKKLRASDIEFKLPRPSYTIDTLAYLNEKYPGYHFSIIMGSDSFSNISKWKNFELLLLNYKIIIYLRPGFPVVEKMNADLEIVKAPMLEISSTAIRQMIAAKKSIRYWVPDVVFEELGKSSFYRSKLKK